MSFHTKNELGLSLHMQRLNKCIAYFGALTFILSAAILGESFVSKSHGKLFESDITSVSCSELPSIIPERKLSLKPHQGGMPFDEIWLCDPLRLAYIHIFKSGGTSIGKMLHAACRELPGVPGLTTRILSEWYGNNNYVRYNLTKLCEEYTCFSAHRDPLERFLSGYHEIMKRKVDSGQASVLPSEISRQHLSDFILKVVNGKISDGHVQPQAFFFGDKARQFRMATIHWTPLEDISSLARLLVCGKYAMYGCSGPCPIDPSNEQLHARSRLKIPGYGIKNFTFLVSDLTPQETILLEKFYRVDFCLFRRYPINALDCTYALS